MDLKELMGDAYNENMSKEDAMAFFRKQVLAGGEYENKQKADAEKKALEQQIADFKKQIADKMTDDEKKKAADEDTKKLIEDLQKQLSDSNKASSRLTALSALAEAKLKAGIKDDDKEFDGFVNNISFEDKSVTENISKYISKIVASAYETGKSEAIKNKLGKMGSFKEGDNDSSGADEKGAYGKQIAEATKVNNTETKNFFERK